MFFPRQAITNPFLQTNPFQLFGAVNPYQLSPMFQSGFAPLGLTPYSVGGNIPWTNPIGSLVGSPTPAGFGAPGLFPPLGQPIGAINPLNPGSLFSMGNVQGSQGFQSGIGPQFQTSQSFGGPFSAEQYPATPPGVLNPVQWGACQLAFPHGGTVNPIAAGITSDPYLSFMLSQQLNQLPIRPLQFGVPQNNQPLGGSIGQQIDPYTLLAHLQLISQLTTNPYQQFFRPYPANAWQQSPGIPSAQFPFPSQTGGNPFGV
jgi:hypothetical protein